MMHTGIDVLGALKAPGMEDLAQLFQARNYARRTLVFQPGHPVDQIFIVASGRLRLYLAYEDKEFTLAILQRGDVYSTHTHAFVAAMDDCTLLCAETALVRRHMLQVPEFTATMVRVLGKVLKHTFGIIDDLAFHDVQTRLLRFLKFMAGQSGALQPGGGVLVNHGLTTEQLANLLGTTRQTLSTMLNTLEREKRIELRGRGVVFISQPDALD